MPRHVARANAKTLALRAHLEQVFAEQRARMGLDLACATRIGLANQQQ
jgi:hypothetical protein